VVYPLALKATTKLHIMSGCCVEEITIEMTCNILEAKNNCIDNFQKINGTTCSRSSKLCLGLADNIVPIFYG
jgi:hypothetical protein